MKFLLSLLLALAMLASTYVQAAEQARVCCGSEDCPLIVCEEMGCMSSPAPVAAQSLVSLVVEMPARLEPLEPVVRLPSQYKVVWAPPD